MRPAGPGQQGFRSAAGKKHQIPGNRGGHMSDLYLKAVLTVIAAPLSIPAI
jgi:hypothetical protein